MIWKPHRWMWQCSLIRELILWVQTGTMEATKTICCMKDESAVDHRTVTRCLKKFCLGCKYLNNLAKPGRILPSRLGL